MPAFKAAILQGKLDLITETLRVVMVDTTVYTFASAHSTLQDIPPTARLATSLPLTGKSVAAGQLAADAAVFPTAVGPAIGGSYLYVARGGDAQSPLILWTDTAEPGSQVQFPFTPSSGNLTLVWDMGAIFAL